MQTQIAKEQVIEANAHNQLLLPNAEELAILLKSKSLHVVLAESCTLGRAAAAFGAIPGISDSFCGSVIAYRDQSKTDWLGIGEVGIKLWSAVCAPVASLMARNVLLNTTEADYSASITGHLGPNATQDLDGVVFIGLAWRDSGEVRLYRVFEERLAQRDRVARLHEASDLLLAKLSECIHATC